MWRPRCRPAAGQRERVESQAAFGFTQESLSPLAKVACSAVSGPITVDGRTSASADDFRALPATLTPSDSPEGSRARGRPDSCSSAASPPRVPAPANVREQALEGTQRLTRPFAAPHDPTSRAARGVEGIAQHALYILASREQPGAAEKLLAPVNRASFAQCTICGVGIVQESGVDNGAAVAADTAAASARSEARGTMAMGFMIIPFYVAFSGAWRLTGDGDALPIAVERVVVPDRVMLCASVVPEHHGVLRPGDPTDE